MISYDLNRPGQNYHRLIKAIHDLGRCKRCLKSAWLVKTQLTEKQVMKLLKPCIDFNDTLIVSQFDPARAQFWLNDPTLCEWIRSPSVLSLPSRRAPSVLPLSRRLAGR